MYKMKPTPVWQSLLKIFLCLLVILAAFFRSHLLPLSGVADFIVSAAALVATVISILGIYKSVCSIFHRLDP